MTFLDLDDLRLTFDTKVKRTKRSQRISFGDGYSQILTDGLNSQREVWSCITPAMEGYEAFSVESYLNRFSDTSVQWSPPDSTKTFAIQFAAGTTSLGYTNISTLTLQNYTRPTNYTANLVTGLLTSVDIPDNLPVKATVTEQPKNYMIRDGWELVYIAPDVYSLSFELERIYV